LPSAGVWSLQLCKYAVVARSLDLALPFAGSVAAMILINAGLVLRATPVAVAAPAAVATALLIQVVETVPVTIAALALAPALLMSTPTVQRHARQCCPWPNEQFIFSRGAGVRANHGQSFSRARRCRGRR
jgi:hypothetical protein